MKTFFTILLIFFFCSVSAQAYSQVLFTQHIKGRYSYQYGDFIRAVNDDLICATKVIVGDSSTNEDIYCIRFNKNGKVLWQKLYGTNASDQSPKLFSTLDNGLLIFASVHNSLTNEYFGLLIKCDSVGNIEWSKKIIGQSQYFDITPVQIIEDSKGNFVLLYDLYTHAFPYEKQMQIAKFNKNGNVIFQTGFNNLYSPYQFQYFSSHSIDETSDNGFIISFEYSCSECQQGPRTYFIRVDKNGEIITYKHASPDIYNNRPILLTQRDKRYIILGYYKYDGETPFFYFTTFNDKTNLTTAKLIPYNIFALQKFSRENNIQIPQVPEVQNITLSDKNKNLINYSLFPKYSGYQTVYITQYDSLARTCPDYNIPLFNYDTTTVNFEIGDEVNNAVKFIDTLAVTNIEIAVNNINLSELECSSKVPIAVIKSENKEAISNTPKKVNIFPNPASNILTISFSSTKINLAYLNIIGVDGKLYKSYNMSVNPGISSKQLDISNLMSGVYFIKITENDKQSFLRFVKK